MTEAENIISSKSAPSNIAIVKYWGKKGIQEPVNPSISFTLSKALTNTSISYLPTNEPINLNFFFDGKQQSEFIPKIQTLVNRTKGYLPFLYTGHLKIESSNTFPHSSGIASSASSMASIALALCDIQMKIDSKYVLKNRNELISEIARLGSGSACRSTQEGWILWGATQLVESSNDRFGVSINKDIHPLFNRLQDTILVIRKGAKSVSSSTGHQLMETHPYRVGRIDQANKNIKKLLHALKHGIFEQFSEVCEEEAMCLHGLMMSSSPAYTLMEPESLTAILRIKKFREDHHVPLTFTLDAGPNIHLIYPIEQSEVVLPFIKEQLQELCENQEVIYDSMSSISK